MERTMWLPFVVGFMAGLMFVRFRTSMPTPVMQALDDTVVWGWSRAPEPPPGPPEG